MSHTGLLAIPIVALLLGFTTWGEEKAIVEETTEQGTTVIHYKIVRAEYIDLAGNRPHTNESHKAKIRDNYSHYELTFTGNTQPPVFFL